MLASAVSRQAALNYPQRAALLKAQLHHRAFFTAHVFRVRSHGNRLYPDNGKEASAQPPPKFGADFHATTILESKTIFTQFFTGLNGAASNPKRNTYLEIMCCHGNELQTLEL